MFLDGSQATSEIEDDQTAEYEEAEFLVRQYQLAEKSLKGVRWVVGALVFSAIFFNDGNLYISGVFWTIAASLLFVTRHNRTLKDECGQNIQSLRRSINSPPPLIVGQLLRLDTDFFSSTSHEVLVGEVMRVDPEEEHLDGTGGMALVLSEPLRGVARAWVGSGPGDELEIKKGDMVRFVYRADDERSFITARLGWRDADRARLEMTYRDQIDKVRRLAREWTAMQPQDGGN